MYISLVSFFYECTHFDQVMQSELADNKTFMQHCLDALRHYTRGQLERHVTPLLSVYGSLHRLLSDLICSFARCRGLHLDTVN